MVTLPVISVGQPSLVICGKNFESLVINDTTSSQSEDKLKLETRKVLTKLDVVRTLRNSYNFRQHLKKFRFPFVPCESIVRLQLGYDSDTTESSGSFECLDIARCEPVERPVL